MTDQPQTAPCTAYIENAHSYGRQHCVRPAEHTDSDAWPRPDHASPLIADAGIAGTAGRIYWDDTHVGAVPHLAAPDSTAVREQLLNAIDFSYCQTLGYATPEGLLAAYDASRTQTVDQAALREIAVQAIRDAACTGDCGETEEECAKERIQPFAWHHGRLAVVEGSPEQFADAVLAAVLPATTNHDTDTSGEPIHCGLCLYGSDVGVPGYDDKGPAYTNPACPDHSPNGTLPVCICGHPEERHFEDVCQTCGCGDYLEPQDAAEVIDRWRRAALEARAELAARLSDSEKAMLRFAIEIAQEEIHARSLELGDDDKAALASLRRVADETAATEGQAECTASRSGDCLREAESETACDTEAGECVHAGQPADGARQDGAQA